jgi:hypothetical protein
MLSLLSSSVVMRVTLTMVMVTTLAVTVEGRRPSTDGGPSEDGGPKITRQIGEVRFLGAYQNGASDDRKSRVRGHISSPLL